MESPGRKLLSLKEALATYSMSRPVVLFKGLLYELPYCIALSHEDWIVRRINTVSGNEIEVFLMPGGEN